MGGQVGGGQVGGGSSGCVVQVCVCVCGQSVWPKCVYVFVCGLSVCRGQVDGWSFGWLVKWVGGSSGWGVKWVCGPSVYVWSKSVAKVFVCVCGLSECGC